MSDRTPTDVRSAILDRLEQLGRSRYWLAEHPDLELSSSAVYRYLRGEIELTTDSVGPLLDALRLQIRPRR